MRVVHINTYDGNGGAGAAMMRLHGALQQLGVHSDALCLYQFRPGSNVTPVYRNAFGKIGSAARILTERYLTKALLPSTTIPFSLQHSGRAIQRHPLVQKADVLHLHWVNHGMLAAPQIRDLLQLEKPLVWSLHDCNPFTGGCHVRYQCERYRESCGKCPALNSEKENDRSHKVWKAKKWAYQAAPIQWIAPSRWMAASVQAASLAKDDPVEVIGNALPTGLFQPYDPMACRKELGLPEDAWLLLAGHMPSSTDRHKGASELRAALRHFRQMDGIDHDKVHLVFFGGQGSGLQNGASAKAASSWPYPCHFAGKIQDERLLARYYSAADCFLFPSLQESLGYTALESLSCGTPVIAFNTSGVTDVVEHEINGYLAKLADPGDFARGMAWLYKHRDLQQLAENGRNHAILHFSSEVIAEKHLNLYTQLLK